MFLAWREHRSPAVSPPRRNFTTLLRVKGTPALPRALPSSLHTPCRVKGEDRSQASSAASASQLTVTKNFIFLFLSPPTPPPPSLALILSTARLAQREYQPL